MFLGLKFLLGTGVLLLGVIFVVILLRVTLGRRWRYPSEAERSVILKKHDGTVVITVGSNHLSRSVIWGIVEAAGAALLSGKRQGTAPSGFTPQLVVDEFLLPDSFVSSRFVESYVSLHRKTVEWRSQTEPLAGDCRLGAVPPFFFLATAGLRLMMKIVASSWCPAAPLGLIHVKTRVEFRSANFLLSPPAGVFLCAYSLPLRQTERGFEYDLCLEFKGRASGHTELRFVETLLSRSPVWLKKPAQERKREVAREKSPVPDGQCIGTLDILDSNLGRNYARVCGDWNPHHTVGAVARLMGFRGAIVQGLFTAEVVLEQLRLAGRLPSWRSLFAVDVHYKLPIVFPKRDLLLVELSGSEFCLRDVEGRPYVNVDISPLTSGRDTRSGTN